MRREWNGLQALFLSECLYAYYVHCFAHRLQLTLVAASREVSPIHQYFSNLNFIINVVSASTKRHDELQASKAAENEIMLASGQLQSGKGANQLGTLQRVGDTRWSSHIQSIRSILNLFDATIVVLEHIMAALNHIISYEFVFISYVVRELLGITDILCQALQKKIQDIVNAVRLVSTTKSLIQRLREDRWEIFLEEVNLFCQSHNILTPDMNALYVARKGRARQQQDKITVEHHYRVDIFYMAIDKQLQELNTRFNDTALGLLTLTGAMEPNNGHKAFDSDKICSLIGRYYPSDFTMQERVQLKYELQHFICEVKEDDHSKLRNLSTLQELCQYLAETGKSEIYYLFDKLIRLILTLPVSTATTKKAFFCNEDYENKASHKDGR